LRDRAVEHRRAAGALANLLRQGVGEPNAGRLAHQPERLRKLLIGNDIEERRLGELRGEALAQRAVEDGVAGGVGEIGQDDRILRSQLRPARPEIVEACDDGGEDEHCNRGAPHG
jgi:hypothetical protein